MLLNDTALDLIAIVSFLAVIVTCIRFKRSEPNKESKFKIIIGLPAYDENRSHLIQSLIGLFFLDRLRSLFSWTSIFHDQRS